MVVFASGTKWFNKSNSQTLLNYKFNYCKTVNSKTVLWLSGFLGRERKRMEIGSTVHLTSLTLLESPYINRHELVTGFYCILGKG